MQGPEEGRKKGDAGADALSVLGILEVWNAGIEIPIQYGSDDECLML
jgi:hypothetical protein